MALPPQKLGMLGAGGLSLLAVRREVAARDRRPGCGSRGCRPCRRARRRARRTLPSPQPSFGLNGSGRFICTVSSGRPFGRVRPRPRGRQHAVEVDVADAVGEQLVGVAVDHGHVLELLEDRLHLVGVVGPEVPVLVVLVERRVREDDERRARRHLGEVVLQPLALLGADLEAGSAMPLSSPATVRMRCIGRQLARGPEVLLDRRCSARRSARPCGRTSRSAAPKSSRHFSPMSRNQSCSPTIMRTGALTSFRICAPSSSSSGWPSCARSPP